MKRFLIILIVALTTVAVLLLIYNPGLLEDIWLWIVGLIGAIVAFVQEAYKGISAKVKQLFNKTDKENGTTAGDSAQTDDLYLLRLHESSGVTLGNLFYRGKFIAFGLEDASQQIQEGNYRLVAAQNHEADKIYKRAFDWFGGHLGIQNGKDTPPALLHIGGLRNDPRGSILITTNLSPEAALQNDKALTNTYRSLYLDLSKKILQGIPVHLVVKNKNWFTDKFN